MMTTETRFNSFKIIYALAFSVIVLLTACDSSNVSDTPASDGDPGSSQDASGADPQSTLGTIDDQATTTDGEATADNATTPVPVQGEADSSPQAARVGLIVDSTQRCAVVFEPFEVVIRRQLTEGDQPDVSGELPNITSEVTFEQSFGTSLSLVSVTGESANFEMSAQDIVGVTASVDGSSVTTFFAGYDRSAPENFIMRKTVDNGCLYAFKSAEHCVAGLSTTGRFSSSRNGLSMSAIGCDLENPDNLAVIELAQ